MPNSGEDHQESGRIGAAEAKRWLEATCRAEVLWNNPDKLKDKLQFRKAAASATSTSDSDFFSFDLGGHMLGGETSGRTFLAEIKHYSASADQGTQYREFLAKCYRAKQSSPQHCDYFMWLTWAPFLSTSWTKLCTAEFIQSSLTFNERTKSIALASSEPDAVLCESLSEQLLIIVISAPHLAHLTLMDSEVFDVKSLLMKLRSV